VAGAAQVMGGDEHVLAALGLPFDDGKAKALGGEVQGGPQGLGRGGQAEMLAFFIEAVAVGQLEQGLLQEGQLVGPQLQGGHDLGHAQGVGPPAQQGKEGGLEGALYDGLGSRSSSPLAP